MLDLLIEPPSNVVKAATYTNQGRTAGGDRAGRPEVFQSAKYLGYTTKPHEGGRYPFNIVTMEMVGA